MSSKSDSTVGRLVDRVFPRMPDFYGLVDEQCDMAVQAMESLVEFMETNDSDKAERVAALEHDADKLKARNIDVLNKAFATPMDREDLYRAITSVDHVLNYGKTTVREIQALSIEPDKYMLEMAVFLKVGAEALQQGFGKLSDQPAEAEPDAQAARKAERNTEKAYRSALAELFDVDKYVTEAQGNGVDVDTLRLVANMFKRREIYRHMSNAADRLARAGDVLHDIVVKIS